MNGKTGNRSVKSQGPTPRKRPLFWASVILGLWLILLGSLLLLIPRLINLEAVHSRITAHLAREIEGTLTYERMDISFFPVPRLLLQHLQMESPGKYQGKAERIAFYAKGFPLLSGRIEINEFTLENPDFHLILPAGSSPAGKEKGGSSLSFLEGMVPALEKRIPNRIFVQNGRFEITRGDGESFALENVKILILTEGGAIHYEGSCRSAFWEHLGFTGRIGEGGRRITLQGPLEGFETAKLLRFYGLPMPFQTEIPGLDLLLNLQIARFEEITGTIVSEIPSLAVGTSEHQIVLRTSALTADLHVTFPGAPASGVKGSPPSDSRILVDLQTDFLEGVYGREWTKAKKEAGRDSLPTSSATVKNLTLSWEGPLLKPDEWRFHGKGILGNASFRTAVLPWEVAVTGGALRIENERVFFRDAEAVLGDNRILLSGSMGKNATGGIGMDMNAGGTIGEEGARWLSRLIKLPKNLLFRHPLSLTDARILWKENPLRLSIENLVIEKGPRINLDLEFPPKTISVKKLEIQDETSQGTLAMGPVEQETAFSFEGNITARTLNAVLTEIPWFEGDLRGRFHGTIVPDAWWKSRLEGNASIRGVRIPLGESSILRILSSPVTFHPGTMTLENTALDLDGKQVFLKGKIDTGEEGISLGLGIESDEIRWENLQLPRKRDKVVLEEEQPSPLPKIRGRLRVSVKNFRYGSLSWSPIRADVRIEPGQVSIDVLEGQVCEISTPGTLEYGKSGLVLHVRPRAAGQPLEQALACLFSRPHWISGTFDLDGEIRGGGQGEDILRSLSGPMNFTAEKGRIYQMTLLSKILAVINITEILRGNLPDLLEEGFAFNAAVIHAVFKDGICHIQEGTIDGASMEIAFHGKIDLVGKKMDLTVGVAPLKTADFVVKKIPILRDILGGNLIAIPVRVTGDLNNPSVIPLDPSAVGTGLLGILERTLKLPVKLIEPLVPEKH